MAALKPSMARASVRAQMTNRPSRLASAAALDAPAHLVSRDDFFALQVPAALGVDLVFDVTASQPQLLEHLDGAGGVKWLAKASIRVDEGGQRRWCERSRGPGRRPRSE